MLLKEKEMKKVLMLALCLPAIIFAMDKDTQLCKKIHDNYRVLNEVVLPGDVSNYADAKNMLTIYGNNLERQKRKAEEYKKNGNDHLFKAICALAPTLKFGNTLITSSSNFPDCQGLTTFAVFLASAQITGYQLKNSILNYYRYLQINVDELEEELVTNKLALKWIEDDHNAKIDNKKKF